MNPKEYYNNYQADDKTSALSKFLVDHILMTQPNSVLEFGCGTGKNLKLIRDNEFKYAKSGIKLFGIDISFINIMHGHVKNGMCYMALGDEDWLSRMHNIDVCFTCSVLDHIEKVDDIIREMKRISKCVFLAETNDNPDDFYYPHDYENFGFKKLNFEWKGEDGSVYYVWAWNVPKGITSQPFFWMGDSFSRSLDDAHDDLGTYKK